MKSSLDCYMGQSVTIILYYNYIIIIIVNYYFNPCEVELRIAWSNISTISTSKWKKAWTSLSMDVGSAPSAIRESLPSTVLRNITKVLFKNQINNLIGF